MIQLYNILFTLFLIASAPYVLIKALFRVDDRKVIAQRLGCLPNLSEKRPLWVHAASVGEVLCSVPLLTRIRNEHPQAPLVLTTMTRAGNETAKRYFPDVDGVFLFPVDHSLVIRRVLQRIQPCLLFIAETELWPNLLLSCGKRGIPVVVFNGRISDKTFQRYLFLRSLFKKPLQAVSLFLMQTEKDQGRMVAIGAPPGRTRVTGNIKFDQTPPSLTKEMISEMARSLGVSGRKTVFIAGSTHSGEEEILLDLLGDLRKEDNQLLFILAPRHLDRLEEVETLLREKGISWTRRTLLSQRNRESKETPVVILLDTLGELMRLYSLATVVFVGGSLVPVGGHNPLEPLFFRKCVLFGPHMFNFSEITRMLIEVGGAVQVRGKEDLSSQLKGLLRDERTRREVGEKGYQLLQKHRGATERIFEEIRPLLNPLRKAD